MSEVFEFVPGAPEEPKPKTNGRFVPGDPRRHVNTGNTAKAGSKKRVIVEGVGLLRAMRHVLANSMGKDRTADEHAARAFLLKDQKGFLKQWNDLEKEDRDRKERAEAEKNPAEAVSTAPDLGHDACCRILDRLLKEAAR